MKLHIIPPPAKSDRNGPLELAKYPIPQPQEPEQFTLHSVLIGKNKPENHPHAHRLLFVCTYRGTAHYKFFHPTLGELTLRYRYAKDTWRNNPNEDGRKTWNFPSRRHMEADVNSSYGILLVGCHQPADTFTLQTFQELTGHPEAKTGFYCHLRNRVVPCKPCKIGNQISPGQKTMHRKHALIFQDIQTLTTNGLHYQALLLADYLPTFLTEVANTLDKILPQWRKTTLLPTQHKLAA